MGEVRSFKEFCWVFSYSIRKLELFNISSTIMPINFIWNFQDKSTVDTLRKKEKDLYQFLFWCCLTFFVCKLLYHCRLICGVRQYNLKETVLLLCSHGNGTVNHRAADHWIVVTLFRSSAYVFGHHCCFSLGCVKGS